MLFSRCIFLLLPATQRVTLFSFTLHIYTIGKLVLHKPLFQLLCVCLSRRTYDDIFAAIHIFLNHTILIKKSPKIDQNQHHLGCRWTISGKRFSKNCRESAQNQNILWNLNIFFFTKSSLQLFFHSLNWQAGT